MKLVQRSRMGPNATIVRTGQTEVLFSYETAVAGYNPIIGFFRTDKHFSKTTARHINVYLGLAKAQVVEQAWIAELLERQEQVVAESLVLRAFERTIEQREAELRA